jgi:ribosomal protein S27AE
VSDQYSIIELDRPDRMELPKKGRFHLVNGEIVDACFFRVDDMEDVVSRAEYCLGCGHAVLQPPPGLGTFGQYVGDGFNLSRFVCGRCGRTWTITEREFHAQTAVCLGCDRPPDEDLQLAIVFVMTAVGIAAAIHVTRPNAIAQIGLMYR